MNSTTDLFAEIQSLMFEHAWLFQATGNDIMRAFLGIHIFLAGLDFWRDRLNMGDAVMLMFRLSIGVTMNTFYSVADPFFGFSFYHFFTDSGLELSRSVNEVTTQQLMVSLDKVYLGMQEPGWSTGYSIDAIANYLILRGTLMIMSTLVFSIACWGWIACAIGVILGPIFVSFFLCPIKHIEGWFWSFCDFLMAYGLLWGVVLHLYLAVMGKVLIRALEALGPNTNLIDQAKYALPSVMVAGAFLFGLTQITRLPHLLLHGHSAGSGFGIGRYRLG